MNITFDNYNSYKFCNNNNTYTFYNNFYSGKNINPSYSDITSIELKVEQKKKKIIDKKEIKFGLLNLQRKIVEETIENTIDVYSIIISRTNPPYYNKIYEDIIIVNEDELEQAKGIVAYIKQYIEKEQIRKEKEKERLNAIKKTDTIDIINENGETETIWRRKTFFGDKVLISEGGKTYHTHADCYENWLDSYKRKFKHWEKISLSDAEQRGYTLCKLCEKYYDGEDD